jgi:murein DD-endopeptidase MepM/ murein hydrolase activator NlpD
MRLIIGHTSLLLLLLVALPATAAPCLPCEAFDRFDKQVRDGRLEQGTAQRQFSALLADIDALLVRTGPAVPGPESWVFPLRGYTLPESGADAAKGYIATGYDYFDGNRHSGHPSCDLFIRDRNRDELDDATGKPAEVVSMTGGVVVAAEAAWEKGSVLRGGKYLWVYDPASRLLVYYAHNRDLLVGVGDRVVPGTPLATVGRSGLNAARERSPTHLHLTVLKVRDGRPVPEDLHRRLRTLRTLP